MESALQTAQQLVASTPAALRALMRGTLVAEWQVYADNEPIRRCMQRAANDAPGSAQRRTSGDAVG